MAMHKTVASARDGKKAKKTPNIKSGLATEKAFHGRRS
jgi:hypothetical protein